MKNEKLTKYLPAGWEEKAEELGALTRKRNLHSAEELFELNMLYLTSTGSMGETSAVWETATGRPLTKTAVYQRIQKSWKWLQWMTEQMATEDGIILPKPEWLTKDVILADGSELSVRGSKKGDYLLHYALDLFNFKCRDMRITPTSEGECLARHDLRPNDIIIADRAYCNIKGIEYARLNGADFLLRYKLNSFKLYDENGAGVDILSRCKALKSGEYMSVPGFYRAEKCLKPVRLVVMRKSKEAEEESARKLRRISERKQRKPSSQAAVELNRYIVLATSLEYTDRQILELYRTRWQIEEVFYRLKELFDFGDVPSKTEASVLAWFYGKLFVAFMAQRLLKRGVFSPEAEKAIRNVFCRNRDWFNAHHTKAVSEFYYHEGSAL